MSGPLEGIMVVDLTTIFSGPYCTMLLADLGADVVKVEAPSGDRVRSIGRGTSPEMGPLFMAVGRNKRVLSLDLKVPAGRRVLARLVDRGDVLVHNMRRSAAQRVGADPESTRARNPGLVHCAVTGFGPDGPYSELPAYDDVVQAASGMVSIQSTDPNRPQYVRSVVADKVVGLMAFGAICAALVQRDRTGEGAALDVPMFETAVSFMMLEHLYGRTFEPAHGAWGYERVLADERRPFRTIDGWLSVVFYDERQWRAFFELIGRAALAQDPRFATHETRTEHTRELYEMVAAEMVSRTTGEWLQILREIDVPAMPVRSIDDLFDDPHLARVGMFARRQHPTEGRYVHVRHPVAFSTGVDDARLPPARPGRHTVELLRELAYSEEEIRDLLASGTAMDIEYDQRIDRYQ
jgi:crotonobetainyl-CoA:carnitine CoA-transferase CaiB-like acyl-CoA transferase